MKWLPTQKDKSDIIIMYDAPFAPFSAKWHIVCGEFLFVCFNAISYKGMDWENQAKNIDTNIGNNLLIKTTAKVLNSFYRMNKGI